MHIGFVVLDLVFQYLSKSLAGKNVSKITYLVSVRRKTLINQYWKRSHLRHKY